MAAVVMDSSEEIWNLAVANYERQIGRKLDTDSNVQQVKTLRDLESVAQDSEDRFKAFRTQHGKLLEILKKCLSPLVGIMNTVGSSLSSSPYAPASIIFSAASSLLEACAAVSKAYDGVQELFQRIADVTTRLNEYNTHNLDASLKIKVAQIVACVFQVIGTTEKLVRQKRVKQWAKAAFLQDDEISPLVDKLKKLIESETGLVTALTYSRVRNIQDTTQDISQRLYSASNAFDEVKIKDVLQSATSVALERKHAQNIQALTKDTAFWIQDDSLFQAWEEEMFPILWVFGRPGMGKSMLAARTIETLLEKHPQHSDIPSPTSVSYLYFKDDQFDLQNTGLMLRAAALQAARANGRFRMHVFNALKQAEMLATPRRLWNSLFVDFFSTKNIGSQSSLAFIIVDGLDEAPPAQRGDLLACLEELVSPKDPQGTRTRIQVVVFARPDIRADLGFEKIENMQKQCIIEVTAHRNSKDIDTFMKHNLAEVAVLRKLKQIRAIKEYQSLAKHIYTSVQSRSQGMFLWAVLLLDQIRSLRSQEAIRNSLATAPRGVDEMLHHTFMRLEVNEQQKDSYLKDLLAWVLCAYTPFSISSLFVLLHCVNQQYCVLLDDDLRYRYASIFNIEDLTSTKAYNSGNNAQIFQSEGSDQYPGIEDDDMDFLESPATDDTHFNHDHDFTLNDETGIRTSDVVDDRPPDEFAIPFEWTQTQVTFAHARVRDFLRTEMNAETRRWHDCSLFSASIAEMKAKIVFACLNIVLAESKISSLNGAREVLFYIKLNWTRHLLDANLETGSSQAIKIARLLADLFHDGTRILGLALHRESFVDFLNTWFNTDKYSTAVRRLIVDHKEHLDKSMQSWAIEIDLFAPALFGPLVATCSSDWLVKSGWDDAKYRNISFWFRVHILFAYSNLNEKGVNTSGLYQYHMNDLNNITLYRLEALGQLSETPKTEHWYAGMAHMVMLVNSEEHIRRAIMLFQQSLDLSPGGSPALEGLALCYGKLGELSTAVKIMQDAIQALPKGLDTNFAEYSLRAQMLDWQRKVDDFETYEQALRLLFEKVRECPGELSHTTRMLTIKHCIDSRYHAQDFKGLLQLIHELDSLTAGEEDKLTLWLGYLRVHDYTEFSVNLFSKLGAICLDPAYSHAEEFISESMERAADLRPQTIALPGIQRMAESAARWMLEYSPRERSRTFCELILKLIAQSDEKVRKQAYFLQEWVAGELATLYFEDALTERRSGGDPIAIVKLIRSLAVMRQGSQERYRKSTSAMVLGMWLHEYAGQDGSDWMAAIKPSIVKALELYLLNDNIPHSDQDGYSLLGRALLYANDIPNAQIALGITMKPIELAQDQSRGSDEKNSKPAAGSADSGAINVQKPVNELYAGFGVKWICDGDCYTKQQDYRELHWCRSCSDVCFCEKCLPRVKLGELSKKCSKHHEHVQMFPMSSDAKRIADALVEGRSEERDEWLDKLKQTWNIQNSQDW